MPLFDAINLFPDETERCGPEQMALDEALLEYAERPVLRSTDGPDRPSPSAIRSPSRQ